MAKIVRAIEDRAKDSPEAANLARDQNAFAGQRDELCHDYAKESLHGYCALRVTQARTALLQTRLEALATAAAPADGERKGQEGEVEEGGQAALARMRRLGPASARGPDCLRGACVARGLDPWSVARRPQVIR